MNAESRSITAARSAVGAVAWRGRNPATLKLNQDAVMIAEHAATASLLVGVFDGHGVNGREVSAWFKERYPRALFTDARFLAAGARGGAAPPLVAVMTDVLLSLEASLVAHSGVNCALSGSTGVVTLRFQLLTHPQKPPVSQTRPLASACFHPMPHAARRAVQTDAAAW
jgi:hypothetical protein